MVRSRKYRPAARELMGPVPFIMSWNSRNVGDSSLTRLGSSDSARSHSCFTSTSERWLITEAATSSSSASKTSAAFCGPGRREAAA